MCGIVGVLAPGEVDRGAVARMRDELRHRGPDHAGLWRSSDGAVCLGHRRLAIVDLNPEANQPFLSADGRFAVTFNGEIYNFRDLRRDLEERGVRFRTQSDTEVLLEAYRQWGEGCLARLSGMFAFAIWDAVEHALFCARDRAGEKPFYYGMVGDAFVFGSELKALLAWPAFRPRIHYPALIDFLTFGFVVDPKCIWEGCRKLPPGHFMKVRQRDGGLPEPATPRRYWDLEFRPDAGESDWGPRILQTLQGAAREMSYADVPVGSFLSGGVDSSSVTAALSRAGCDVTAFTVGFEEQEYDERPWARRVAAIYDTPLVERTVRADDVIPVLDKMVWHYDEPFNDYSYLPTYYLCREARTTITVALSGDGGDELFAGYRKYQRLASRESVQSLLPRPVGRWLARGAASVLPADSPARRTAAQYGADPAGMLTDMLLLGFSLEALRKIACGPLAEALRHYGPRDAVDDLLVSAPPAEVGLVNAMRYLDLKITLAGDILVKVDRASMAVSLEVRPVYLHREMLALAEEIPAARLADRGHSKEAVKRALRAWLPEELLYRPKQGFAMPLTGWLESRPELLEGLREGEDAGPLAELLDAGAVRGIEAARRGGGGHNTSLLHSMIFLRRWLLRWGAS